MEFKEIRIMDKDKVKQTAVYHNILYSLCNVLPVDRDIVANNVMPILEEIIGVYCDANAYIADSVLKATKPMIVKSDNFDKERFIEKVCSFLECGVTYIECDDPYNFDTDQFIKDFKEYIEE